MLKQLSVFLENKTGRLTAVTEVLAEYNINIRALSLADTSDFGILRLIVNEPKKAYEILKKDGFTVRITDVIGVEMPDRPGGLNGVLQVMKSEGINIEYLYAFLGTNGRGAVVIFRVENMEKAMEILQEKGIQVLSPAEL
ncbi:MAG: hypothetical protein PWQ96_1198 [Clostridia bacterium]|nr:hypothetical protein [Clostridia bacterium]